MGTGSAGRPAALRSMSANRLLGCADPTVANRILRQTGVRRPTMMWVFIDENPNTINDGSFLVTGYGNNTWVDFPATYHNKAGGLSFLDGHAEIRKWTDPSLLIPKAIADYSARPGIAPFTDLRWLQERSENR